MPGSAMRGYKSKERRALNVTRDTVTNKIMLSSTRGDRMKTE